MNGEEIATRRAGLVLAGIFAASVICLFLVYYNFPKLDRYGVGIFDP